MKNLFYYLKKTFPRFVLAVFLVEIEKHLTGCKSILDVGCGDNSPIKYYEKKYNTLGIDGYKPSITKSKKRKIHNKYIYGDINKLNSLVKKGTYDAAIALDVIEHLTKSDGYKLLKNMERAAKKKVILVTPNGFIPQHNKENDLQEHLSGWTVKDFKKAGYKVEGIYGTKFCDVFRTEEAELRWRPKFFWGLVWGILAVTTHYLYTKKNPEKSVSLLATKDLT